MKKIIRFFLKNFIFILGMMQAVCFASGTIEEELFKHYGLAGIFFKEIIS